MSRADLRTVAVEHVALREMSWRVLALVDGSLCPCCRTGCADCTRREIEALSSRLAAHFRAEEAVWARIDRGDADRTTLAWIERMRAEHRDLERRLAEAAASLRALGGDRLPRGGRWEERARAVVRDLVQHELGEARLFQRSVFESSISGP